MASSRHVADRSTPNFVAIGINLAYIGKLLIVEPASRRLCDMKNYVPDTMGGQMESQLWR